MRLSLYRFSFLIFLLGFSSTSTFTCRFHAVKKVLREHCYKMSNHTAFYFFCWNCYTLCINWIKYSKNDHPNDWLSINGETYVFPMCTSASFLLFLIMQTRLIGHSMKHWKNSDTVCSMCPIDWRASCWKETGHEYSTSVPESARVKFGCISLSTWMFWYPFCSSFVYGFGEMYLGLMAL